MPAPSKRMDATCTSEWVSGARENTILTRYGEKNIRLWWRFSGNATLKPPATSNYALTALLPLAMKECANLHVNGTVDKTLLENLEEVIDAWTMWRPDLFQRIRISADAYTRNAPGVDNDAALMYSGGVDANYALIAHKGGLLGHRNRKVMFAVMVQGFDIPLNNTKWYETARQHALPILSEFACPMLDVQTNWRTASIKWEMDHGFGITSVLHQLDSNVTWGLWAADEPYNREVIPWGSNSISNPLLSAGAFPIRTVGAGLNRSAKIKIIGAHNTILENMRVCWRNPDNGLNCGTCEKCVRTRLALSAHGIDEVNAFPGTLTPKLVSRIEIGNHVQYELLEEVLSIKDSRLKPELHKALRKRLATYERSEARKRTSWFAWTHAKPLE